MHYVTVFDATSWSAMLREWPILAMLAVMIVVVGPNIYSARPEPGERSWKTFHRRVSKIVFPVVMLAMLGFASGLIGAPILSAKALRAGNCTVMEGVVRNFRAQPHPKADETFDLNGVHFGYNPARGWGYRQLAAQGGALHEGVQVRLCNFDGAILKLEVAR